MAHLVKETQNQHLLRPRTCDTRHTNTPWGGGQSQIHLNTLCTNVICKDGTRGTRHREQRTNDANKTLRTRNTTRWSASMWKSVLLLELRCGSPSCYIIRIRAPVSTMSNDLQGPSGLGCPTSLIWTMWVSDRAMVGYEHPQHHRICLMCHEDMR